MKCLIGVLAAVGASKPQGTFMPLPAVPEVLLAEGFWHRVLEFLAHNGAISEGL